MQAACTELLVVACRSGLSKRRNARTLQSLDSLIVRRQAHFDRLGN